MTLTGSPFPRCIRRRPAGGAVASALGSALMVVLGCADVAAQTAPAVSGEAAAAPRSGAPTFVFEPTVAIRQTFTDNARLTADKRSDSITEISPGFRISSRSGALRGSLGYSANGVAFARDSERNDVQHALSANGVLEVLPGQAGINASATVGRQVISAFGTQAAGAVLNDANTAELSTYSLSPYLRGRLLGSIDAHAQLTYSGSHSSSTSVGDSTTLAGQFGLSGRSGLFGWSLDASRTRTEPDVRATTTLSQWGGSLNWQPDIEWRLAVHASRETNDVRLGIDESHTTWGLGLTWLPGPRTKLDLRSDRRFFGRSHGLTFTHRMARSMWTFTDSRDLNLGGANGGGRVSWYDLFFEQLSSLIPDPVQRDAVVRAILARGGLDPDTQIGGFLSASPSLVRRQVVGVTLTGIRTTVTWSAFRSRTSRLAGTDPNGEDLALADAIRQLGMTFSLTHRLTSQSSLTLAASLQRTLDAGALPGNDLRQLTATWTSQFGPRSHVSLGLRRAQFDSETNPYHESALLGSFSMRF